MTRLLPQGVSLDDQDIPTRPKTPPPSNYPERRAHSSSPVKNRHTIILPQLTGNKSNSSIASPEREEDLRSILACPTLTPAQLKRISKSPVTKKLHVAAMSEHSKYIIPVPFTLKLPPRLTSPATDVNSSFSSVSGANSRSESQESSPARLRQSKLIYTSQGYAKVESSSSDEEEETKPYQDIIESRSPRNRIRNNMDTLSIIEEVSNNGSRQNTIKENTVDKSLPPTPKPMQESAFIDELEIRPRVPTKKLTRKPPPIEQDFPLNTAVVETKPVDDTADQPNRNKTLPKVTTIVQPKNDTSNIAQPETKPLPKLNIIQPSITNRVNDSNVLKIDKRSFSDESLVSSISSLSSVGDFMKREFIRSPPPVKFVPINNKVTRIPQTTPTTREAPKKATQSTSKAIPKPETTTFQPPKLSTTRNISESSTGSNDSWNSIQESVDISITTPQKLKKTYRKSFPLLSYAKEPALQTRNITEGSWEDIEDEIQPLCINKKVIDEPLKRDFQFPNNSLNITNSNSIKETTTFSHKPRYSFYSNTGQIEIPDLENKSVMDELSSKAPSSYAGTTFSETQTQTTASDIHDDYVLGIPGKQAIAHLRNQFNMVAGEDSDSDIFSTYIPGLKQLQVNPTKEQVRSPSRHARHRSMFNIDFNPDKEEPLQVNALSHIRAQSVVEKKEISAELMNIKVAAPPSKVNYAVDFKESNSIADDTSFNMTKLPDIRTSRSNSKVKKGKDIDSDSESVVIDLTENEYDLCLINRKDSVLSYKSVTEKLNGKEVEVVLVDDDTETKPTIEKQDTSDDSDTDDELSSIYSKYRHNWMFRSNTTSTTNSFKSAVDSLSHIKQPQKIEIKTVNASTVLRELNSKRGSISSSSSSSYVSNRIQPPVTTKRSPRVNARKSMPIIESNYFDYKSNDSYDFNTFMKQRIDSTTSKH
ncbi:hypothetical protein JA1_000700 [Spathaspora sp. JA1]|nr:hypothetical protein JA1_000700 [Spathaspora sp. JA1]